MRVTHSIHESGFTQTAEDYNLENLERELEGNHVVCESEVEKSAHIQQGGRPCAEDAVDRVHPTLAL